MKGHVIITLLFIVIVSKTSLGSDVFNELGVYEKSVSPTRIYRLWLMASQKYVLALYEKNRITLDSGNFTIIKRQINLKSQIDKKFSPATLPQKIYVTKNGLCESPNFLSRKIIWKKSTIRLYPGFIIRWLMIFLKRANIISVAKGRFT